MISLHRFGIAFFSCEETLIESSRFPSTHAGVLFRCSSGCCFFGGHARQCRMYLSHVHSVIAFQQMMPQAESVPKCLKACASSIHASHRLHAASVRGDGERKAAPLRT
eukprot:5282195-Amphidinium_carterae.1